MRNVPLLTVAALAMLIACAGPAAAQRIDTTQVQLPTGASAYVAWPPGKGKAPAMVVLGDGAGSNPQTRSMARRLAAEGYVAVVPDIYRRRDDSSAPPATRDVSGTLDWLATQPRVQPNRTGVIGFGLGGTVALEHAMVEPRLRAVVMYYGVPVTDAGRLTTLKAPVLAHFGQLDDGIPESKVNDFRLAMSTSGKQAEIQVYPGAGHAFMDDAAPSLHPESARRAWARTLAFLQKQIHD